MKPTPGRMLHYISRGSADGMYPSVHVPFLVVSAMPMPVFENTRWVVSGWTFNSHGFRYEEHVPLDEEGEYNTACCHWPEREG